MAIAEKQRVRFGPYELDVHSGELWKNGTRLKLQPQPIQVLAALLEHPGELITREQLQHRLWPNDTFVDFEQGLNTAIKKLRVALCDEAETPKYIETLPKRGYRFIAEVRFCISNHVVEQDPLAGRLLSHYRLVERIGEGGMGVVYRAHDERLDRDVALKILPEGSLEDEAARQRFRKEALALSKLNHPNIAMIFDFDSENGTDFLVEELIEGVSLNEMLTAGPLREKDVIKILSQLCEGLAAAHEHGIIHRDIKPANIRVTLEPHVKILDFGLAETLRPPNQAAGETITLSEAQVVSGTLPYMSPEQLRNEKLDGRTDIWATGCVLYEMATGRRPFLGEGSVLIDEILNQQPAQPSKLNHRISPGLEGIIQKCMEKDVALRYRSARDIAVDLRRLPQPASNGSVVIPPPAPRRRKWRWIAVASAPVLIVLAAFVAPIVFPRHPRIVGTRQLTHTGLRKVGAIATDGSRVFFVEQRGPEREVVEQVSVAGGDVTDIPTHLNDEILIGGISPSTSELLLDDCCSGDWAWRSWIQPVPAGPARRAPIPYGSRAQWAWDGTFLYHAGDADVYRSNADGSNEKRLFEAPSVFYAKLSPNGDRVRFHTRWRTPDSKYDIMEVGIDGSNPHPVFPEMKGQTRLGGWTADGKLFYFERRNGPAVSLWAVRESSFHLPFIHPQPTLLYAGPLELTWPGASRNTKELYVTGTDRRGELSVYDARSSNFVPYLGGISASYVSFSPDHQWIAYVAYRDGTLWKSRVNGGERMQLTFPPMGVLLPRWSPDGKFIVFTEWFASEYSTIYLVPAEGGQPQLLATGPLGPMDPTWSPDSRHIVYGGAMERGSRIVIVDLDTMISTEVPGSENLFSPRWSPDGKYIVALTVADSQLRLYSFEHKQWQPLQSAMMHMAWPAWSHDSKFVYVSGNNKIVRINIANDKSETVVNTERIRWTSFALDFIGWFDLTPDDRIMILRDTGSQEIYALELEY